MPILQGDIKLMQSQRMTDNDDGGGRITGNEVVDGQSNGIFDDITDLDRTTGNVSLAKVFPTVHTDDTDTYMGTNLIIVERAQDPNVHVTMFSTGNHDDLRADARDQVERFVVQGARATFTLLGNHFANQRQLLVFQRPEIEVPTAGQRLMLENDLGEQQFVRITEVESEVQTYTVLLSNNYVDFQRRRITLGISAPLVYDFPGGDPTPTGSSATTLTGRKNSSVYATEVADAARYWGIRPTVAAAELGDLEVYVDDVYSTLVPSAQSETPITDLPMFPTNQETRPAAAASRTESAAATYLSGTTIRGFLNRPAVRGSVTLTLDGATFTDTSAGTLERTSGASAFTLLEIDYTTGEINGARDSGTGSGSLSGSATYTPGAPFAGKRMSHATEIDLASRGYNYVETFPNAKPRPGTLSVAYMVLGKWYTMADRGDGVLEGRGTGTLNFTTGTISITLEALPDVGSAILWQYVVDIGGQVQERSGTLAKNPEITLTSQEGMEPGSVAVTYTAGGQTMTLTDAATLGELAGDGTGTIDYGRGVVKFQPSVTPDNETDIGLAYDLLGATSHVFQTPSIVGGSIVGTIPGAPLTPGSVSVRWVQTYIKNGSIDGTASMLPVTFQDDGVGGFLGRSGSINYSTGEFSIAAEIQYQTKYFKWDWRTKSHQQVVNNRTMGVSGSVFVNYTPAGAAAIAQTETQTFSAVTFQLDSDASPLLPNSLLFEWAGQTYYDRDGILYTAFNPATGSGTAVGAINYSDKTLQLDTWPAGAVPGIDVLAAATVDGLIYTTSVAFRAPGAPLRSQSMNVTVTDSQGNLINESADVNGDIVGTKVQGTVNVETGVVVLEFTDGVDAVEVIAETGRYNAILVQYLPLDSNLIGLDPVRLPSDGRVPIYRPGDVVVVHHRGETPFPMGVTQGQELNVGRTRLAALRLEDANGEAIPADRYAVNLDTGIVTLATPLDTTGHPEPWRAVHRVEDMTMLAETDISGRLSLTRALSHDFPIGSNVSTALIMGDLQARVTNLFDQSTWTSVWSDQRIGSEPTSEYNEAAYPVTVTNRGALQQRWALIFTSNTNFRIVGETIGEIGNGSINVDIAPVNPNTGVPYFTILAAGWGQGWAAGNVLRFNTIGAAYPVWVARTVLQSDPAGLSDTFRLQIRGNVNA